MFNERLRSLRLEKGETMKVMSGVIGITEGAYSKYENNRAEPSIENLIKMANHFDVSLDYLLGKTNIMNKSKENEVNEIMNKFENLNASNTSEIYAFLESLDRIYDYYKLGKINVTTIHEMFETLLSVLEYSNILIEETEFEEYHSIQNQLQFEFIQRLDRINYSIMNNKSRDFFSKIHALVDSQLNAPDN